MKGKVTITSRSAVTNTTAETSSDLHATRAAILKTTEVVGRSERRKDKTMEKQIKSAIKTSRECYRKNKTFNMNMLK